MEKFELDVESQLDFIALNQNLNAIKAFSNENLSKSANINAKYLDLINNSFVAANESNQPVIVSEYSIGNESFQKEFDNYKDFIHHVSPFSLENNNELSSKEPESAFKHPETFLKDEVHLKLFNETQVDVKEIMASVENQQYGFEAYQLDQSLKLVQGFVKEQQKVGGIDDGHAEIILQSKVDMNAEERPIIKVDSSYKGKKYLVNSKHLKSSGNRF